MYYDDQARRFNFVSGLLCGCVLGAGLALLVVPQEGVRPRRVLRRARRAGEAWRDRLAERLEARRAQSGA